MQGDAMNTRGSLHNWATAYALDSCSGLFFPAAQVFEFHTLYGRMGEWSAWILRDKGLLRSVLGLVYP